MSKPKAKQEIVATREGPLFSVRFVISLLLIAAGIVYVVLWTLYVRDLRTFEQTLPPPKGGKPSFLIPGAEKLDDWNWIIGFGLIFLGLTLAAHKSTPLGRGRGVVIGMLGCFLIGLLWIVIYYVTGQDLTLPLFTDLGQYNLMVGIGFMAVGFVYATHWE